jgi:hypothetical protein
MIHVHPLAGDNWQMLQGAIDFCINNPGYELTLESGNYFITRPLIIAKISNGQYQQVSLAIRGSHYAKNTPGQYTANIICVFTYGFGIGIQLGKGVEIRNISIQGQYTFPNSLNLLQLDTLSSAEWNKGVGSNPTSPYAGIVIDPFSDLTNYDSVHLMYKGLESYYLFNMNRSGSTAINIAGCSIQNFLVGVMVTPSNQQNAELINLSDSHIEKCKSAYAFTQAQSKTNIVYDLECWGFVRTVFDGNSYGFGHGDGATCPYVDIVNIAGGVYQILDAYSNTFSISMSHIYAELLFRIGFTGGFAGAHFSDWQIDFGSSSGFPSPDCWYFGTDITWDNCMLRVYGEDTRIILNGVNSVFNGGTMSSPPICRVDPQDNVWTVPQSHPPTFNHVRTYYYPNKWINSNDYDSVKLVSNKTVVHVDRSNFNGYFIGSAGVNVGDILLIAHWLSETTITTFEYPLGYVTAISGDTVHLTKMGVGIHDGDAMAITVCKIKH